MNWRGWKVFRLSGGRLVSRWPADGKVGQVAQLPGLAVGSEGNNEKARATCSFLPRSVSCVGCPRTTYLPNPLRSLVAGIEAGIGGMTAQDIKNFLGKLNLPVLRSLATEFRPQAPREPMSKLCHWGIASTPPQAQDPVFRKGQWRSLDWQAGLDPGTCDASQRQR